MTVPALSTTKVSVLVTGATGFIGRRLCGELVARGYAVVGAVRRNPLAAEAGLTYAAVGEIGGGAEWADSLSGVEMVVHLAARVHVMRESATDALAEFRRVNVAGTERLAREAARLGVRRFVYVSSIKVNGEQTSQNPFDELGVAHPQEPYAVSKWEAEQVLHRVAHETGMEVVIVRPPLVYGPGVGGNFLRLMSLVDRGLPLPFGLVDNRRSLVFLGNLVDALRVCLVHPNAANKTFLVKDAEDVSTPQLVRQLAGELGKSGRLLPVPLSLMRATARIVGKANEFDRLLGSLVLDDSAIRRDLGWQPPFLVQDGLRVTAGWFKNRER